MLTHNRFVVTTAMSATTSSISEGAVYAYDKNRKIENNEEKDGWRCRRVIDDTDDNNDVWSAKIWVIDSAQLFLVNTGEDYSLRTDPDMYKIEKYNNGDDNIYAWWLKNWQICTTPEEFGEYPFYMQCEMDRRGLQLAGCNAAWAKWHELEERPWVKKPQLV